MISESNKLMLEIIGDALHNKKTHIIDPENWSEILKEMTDQTVFAIPSEILDLSKTGQAEQISYLKEVTGNIQKYHKIMAQQDKLLSILENAKISSAILKGAGAAINYPTPHLRCMGDIDIIVRPEDFEKTFQLLCDAGYKNKDNLDNYHRHIGFKTNNGIEIELHNYFSTSDNVNQNKILDEYVYEGISKK